MENLWNFKSEFCIQVECFPYKSINYSTQGLNNQSPIWMIADSKIPEMPLKCTAEVFFPCPAHLFAAYRSYIVMDLFPCPAHLFAAYRSYIVMDLFPCPAHLFTAYRSCIVMDLFPCPAHLFGAYRKIYIAVDAFPGPRPLFVACSMDAEKTWYSTSRELL